MIEREETSDWSKEGDGRTVEQSQGTDGQLWRNYEICNAGTDGGTVVKKL